MQVMMGRWPSRFHAPLLVITALVLAGCLGGDEEDHDDSRETARLAQSSKDFPSRQRLARLGLTIGPPTNLVQACKRVARQTNLTVYCPPIVPVGPVEAPERRRENAYVFGHEGSYGLSLQSESLIDTERARAYAAEGPPITFPNRHPDGDNIWSPLAAKHWVVAATASPAIRDVKSLDERAARPRFESSPEHFTVGGVEATLITGDLADDLAGLGFFAGSGHAIAYWQIADTFYEASVHFDDKARMTEMIARGLIVQMVDCVPGSSAHESRMCDWVFPGRG